MNLKEMENSPDKVPAMVVAEVLKAQEKSGKEGGKKFLALTLSDNSSQLEVTVAPWDFEKMTERPQVGSTHKWVIEKNGKYFNVKMGEAVGAKTGTTQTPLPNAGSYSLAELSRIMDECKKLQPANQSGDAQLAISLFIQAMKCGIRIPKQREPGEDLPY
jgi:DNA polymerase III alpha subunit